MTNIQVVQGISRILEGRTSSGKGNVSGENDLSRPQVSLPETQKETIVPDNSNLSGEQLSEVDVIYPPFFPLGDTQVIFKSLVENKLENSSDNAAQARRQPIDTAQVVSSRGRSDAAKETEKNENSEVDGPEDSPGSVFDLKV